MGKPIFKQAGLEFVVRNGGIGGACGDNYMNQALCLEHIVGNDVDVTHWSWDYFGPDSKSMEEFIRVALSMPSRPMPMLLLLGRPDSSHEKFANVYADLGYHAMGVGLGLPPGVPGAGANQSFKWGFIGDGYKHTMTRSAEKFPKEHCRRKSTGALWRNWHGGPLLYQLIADSLGWTYVSALKEALELRQSGMPFTPPKHAPLPAGLESSLRGSPRCLAFNRPSFAGQGAAVKLVNHEGIDVMSEYHRKDMLQATEKHEERCEHLDACGTANNSRDGRFTFDLRAKYKKPLTEGKLVVCIGGSDPDKMPQLTRHWSIATLPHIAKFPRCAAGAIEHVEVDGERLDIQRANPWSKIKKCGEFQLDKKDVQYVTVQSACGVTHVIAM